MLVTASPSIARENFPWDSDNGEMPAILLLFLVAWSWTGVQTLDTSLALSILLFLQETTFLLLELCWAAAITLALNFSIKNFVNSHVEWLKDITNIAKNVRHESRMSKNLSDKGEQV